MKEECDSAIPPTSKAALFFYHLLVKAQEIFALRNACIASNCLNQTDGWNDRRVERTAMNLMLMYSKIKI